MTRAIWPWLRTVCGLGIIAVLVWRLGGGAFLDGLRVIDGPALLVALGIGLVTTVAAAGRWCLVVRRLGLRLSPVTAIGDYYRAQFLNTVLPCGVLGDVHRAVRHGQDAGDVGRGVRAVVIERAGGQIVLIVAGLGVLCTRAGAAERLATPLAVAVPCAIALLAVALCTRNTTVWRRLVTPVLRDVRLGLLARDTWPGVIALSAVGLAGHLALFLVAARLAGSTAPLLQLLPLMVPALLAMGLPVNIGGWGPREGVSAWAFAAAGLGAAQGVTVAVVYGVLTFGSCLPGAVVLVFRALSRPRTERDEPTVAEPEPRPKHVERVAQPVHAGRP